MKKILSLFALAIPSVAFAHAGHDHASLLAGLFHPMSGIDHLLAMLAVGLWAASFSGYVRWLISSIFVSAMLIGFAIGLQGFELPHTEAWIAASVMILGMMVAWARKIPTALAGAMVAVFAVFHGMAHGSEMSGGSELNFAFGFVLTTAALHAICMLVASQFNAKAWTVRLVGLAMGMTGLYLTVA